MFRSLASDTNEPIELCINGQLQRVPAGISVWAAMALSDQTTTRIAPVTEQPRSAYCAMGVCFECLVEIDGMPNRQACLVRVQPGMQINRQQITEQTQAEAPSNGLQQPIAQHSAAQPLGQTQPQVDDLATEI
ncbi:(2Fe-2S)-binding protein [Motiliproteus coralliicola]|uniref:(2Fe-2S)-binding protein n=1 Tax=Motiliproteus coralliicola TaxID=2283196 RepID=A0A369W8S8_9GAMM|nr:(2Fe-2S)-binding protein [Motiliproteus coralliicola]RDE18390.1 (2Fe-2S)-binding protein [Motiliproteus coralliicola]